jgi:hypothetical protein
MNRNIIDFQRPHNWLVEPAQEATHRDYLRQLQAEGIDVEIPEEWQENSRALDIVLAGPAESTVFESATGGVYNAVPARLVAERSGLILTDWDMSTEYDGQIVPESFDNCDPLWNLGGQVYRQGEVLNLRIEKGTRSFARPDSGGVPFGHGHRADSR